MIKKSFLFFACMILILSSVSCKSKPGGEIPAESVTQAAYGEKTNEEANISSSAAPVSTAYIDETKPKIIKYKTKQPESVTQWIKIKKYSYLFTCFKFETSKGLKIITDPYEMDEDIEADIVSESHQHIDHNDVSRIKGNYKLLTAPGEYSIKDVNIIGLAGHHNKGDAIGSNNIFVFDVDGVRIAEFASQCQEPDEEMYSKISYADILILQVCDGGNGKLTLDECKNIALRLKAKIIIPAHGKARLEEPFAKLIGADVYISDSREFCVDKASLEKINKPRVLILDIEEARTGKNPYSFDAEMAE